MRDTKREQLILFQCFICRLLNVTLQGGCQVQRSLNHDSLKSVGNAQILTYSN